MKNDLGFPKPEAIVRQTDGTSWQIELPHSERPDSVFVSFVRDQAEALWLVRRMRPDLPVRVVLSARAGSTRAEPVHAALEPVGDQ